ncbi:putative metalloprotease CJM1_0395 family protein [Paremcibacter congregatus]|uniref:putative metalloprotease CJM1_0395 family protein n=1 Tax=Paremcibacter congregatus TaxID=2043170 RepID=UPI003A919E42
MVSGVSAVQPHFFSPPAKKPAEATAAPDKNKPAEQGPTTEATLGELTEEEKILVEKLKKTDQEVKAHEQAHKNAGGQYAGSASFTYQSGPDGKRYAVGGEVPIDISPVAGDPRATIAKMSVIIAAALAPAQPSGQDRSVAAQASAARAEAQAELSAAPEEGAVPEDGVEEDSGSVVATGRVNNSGLAAYQISSQAQSPETTSGRILNFIS